MKKLLVAILFYCTFTCAWALNSDTVKEAGFSKLTAEQQAEVLKQVANLAAQTEVPSTTKVEKTTEIAERWVNIGGNIGKALGGAAKELGIAVNDFAKTPMGQLTVVLVIWHIMGGMIIHVIIGLLIWVVGFSMLYIAYNKMNPAHIEYFDKTNWCGKSLIKSKQISDKDNGFWIILGCCVGIMGIIIMLTW